MDQVQGEFYFGLRPEIFHKREIFSRWSIITKKHQAFIWYQMRKRICGGVAATRNQFFLPQPASHWTALTPLSIDTALCDPVQQSPSARTFLSFFPHDPILQPALRSNWDQCQSKQLFWIRSSDPKIQSAVCSLKDSEDGCCCCHHQTKNSCWRC